MTILFYRNGLKELGCVNSVLQGPFGKLTCVNSVLQDLFKRASLCRFCSTETA
jgi:hypothetical protein